MIKTLGWLSCVAALGAALGGCVVLPIKVAEVVETDLLDAQGASKARATLKQQNGSVRVTVSAASMAPGVYAAHVHTTGRCDAPDFTTAGGHWNPTAKQHGRDNPAGAHLGDLPNLQIGANGRGSVSFVIEKAGLNDGPNPMLDADGAAVMIHAAADDYRTDPSGSSGARIACGIVLAR